MKRGFAAAFGFLIIAVFLISIISAQEQDKVTIKFFSKGDGKNVSIDLKRYLGESNNYFHSPAENIDITIKNGVAVIAPKGSWAGEELIVFSANATLAALEPFKDEDVVNLEPVIESAIPEERKFGASASGQIQFTVVAYDPDNDRLLVEWFVNGLSVKSETSIGGVVSHYTLNEDKSTSQGGIATLNYDESGQQQVVYAVVNDSKSSKVVEWRFSIINQSCTDVWVCGNWSSCSAGKRKRECERISECEEYYNLPATEKIDPECFSEKICLPNWTCEDWGDCRINYNFELLKHGVLAEGLKIKQERLCYDSTYCIGNVGVETRDCNGTVPVQIEEVRWCNESYLEVYDATSGFFVSRIRKAVVTPQLDIDLSLRQLSRADACWYCFNSKQDFDETGVDCGGACGECIELESPGVLSYARFFIFLFFDIILVVALIVMIRRVG